MDLYTILLRLVYIVAGVFWAGAAFSLAMFIMPAINTSTCIDCCDHNGDGQVCELVCNSRLFFWRGKSRISV